MFVVLKKNLIPEVQKFYFKPVPQPNLNTWKLPKNGDANFQEASINPQLGF